MPGDLVGYGPDPNEVIERIAGLPNLQCLMGNHDAAALNHIDMAAFNPEARQAVIWTQQQLKPDNVNFLRTLPEKIEIDMVTLSHRQPPLPDMGIPA